MREALRIKGCDLAKTPPDHPLFPVIHWGTLGQNRFVLPSVPIRNVAHI